MDAQDLQRIDRQAMKPVVRWQYVKTREQWRWASEYGIMVGLSDGVRDDSQIFKMVSRW